MGKKIRNIICTVCFAAFIAALVAAFVIKEPVDVLVSERRKAAQFPKFSVSAIMDKSFFDGIEDYITDQFPLRDTFRSIKAAISMKVFGQKDNGGTFIADGHISELSATLKEESVKNAAEKINSIYDKYLDGKANKVYFSIVPDKNFYLAEKNGYPSLDYSKMTEILKNNLGRLEYIDITDCLDLDSYYRTDSHWKQEKIGAVAKKLSNSMGFAINQSYTEELLGKFDGVYASRFASATESDDLICLRNEITDSAKVYNAETKESYVGVYDTKKLKGNDKYDVFLSGAVSVISAENPHFDGKKELVIFRDSFGSSLAPLLLEGYSKITLVDTRYISPVILGDFVDFDNCDVLFIYNTTLYNQSNMLK